MITVEEATHIVLGAKKDFGKEYIAFQSSLGRVLAEAITADRDMPPFDRVAMDGIAISYDAIQKGITSFQCKGIQAAGDEPLSLQNPGECVEIMTGCALPPTADTVIRYEDVMIQNGLATLQTNNIKKAQNIHSRGTDKKQGDVVAKAGQIITPALINVLASVGATRVCVQKLPKTVIISTGNELVDVQQQPGANSIRRSNNYMMQAALKGYGMDAKLLHIADNPAQMKEALAECFANYDVIIASGGVSAGRFDHLPEVLQELGVKRLFHKVKQRPGKPFWFGEAGN
ncbi:MAG TPA: molybdopterin molybdotransferase MoeA, partial [Chitinophagaceae bacterium]|nr:molybdopterin molybdotransferase MoeA [Chitinophagaceae bacterium]